MKKGYFFFVCTLVSALAEAVDEHIESQTRFTRRALPSAGQRIISALDLLAATEPRMCLAAFTTRAHCWLYVALFTATSFSHSKCTSLQSHWKKISCLKSALMEVNFWGVSFTRARLNSKRVFSLKFSSASFQIKNQES